MRKAEGELIENIVDDSKSKAERLLKICKERDAKRDLVPVTVGKTTFLIEKKKLTKERMQRRKDQLNNTVNIDKM